ncbi:MAG: hypothetical protein M5R40_13315 [Anaerolineae bacterium]|nr:hypothetical protein [Anaerolineae bacterium]
MSEAKTDRRSGNKGPAPKPDSAEVRRRPAKEPTAPDVDLPPLDRQSKVPRFTNEGFSLDRKLDLLGVVFVVFALIALLGYVSEPGNLTGAVLNILGQLFGWLAPGAIALVGFIGVWLILRNFRDRPPRLQVFRLIGFVLLCLTLLVGMHFAGMNFSPGVDPRNFEVALWHAQQGEGGGYIGAYTYQFLVEAAGVEATGIGLLGAVIASLMLALGLTFNDIGQAIVGAGANLRKLVTGRRRRAKTVIVMEPPQDGAPGSGRARTGHGGPPQRRRGRNTARSAAGSGPACE